MATISGFLAFGDGESDLQLPFFPALLSFSYSPPLLFPSVLSPLPSLSRPLKYS